MKTIELTAPVTLTFSPEQIRTVVVALQELPYKYSQPLLDHIYEACQPKDEPTP